MTLLASKYLSERGVTMKTIVLSRLLLALVSTAGIALAASAASGEQSSPRLQVAFLRSDALSAASKSYADHKIQEAQATISVTPDTVDTGSSPSVTLNSAGFFDLSQVTASQIGLRPGDGVSNIQIVSQTAQHLTLSFQLADAATPGVRTLFINNGSGATLVALDLTLRLGANVCIPACGPSQICMSNRCEDRPPPPVSCSPKCDDDFQDCVNGKCVNYTCTPSCRTGYGCNRRLQCVPRI
jgi:hypothetical protein